MDVAERLRRALGSHTPRLTALLRKIAPSAAIVAKHVRNGALRLSGNTKSGNGGQS